MQLRKIDFLNYFSQGPFSWQGQKGLCTNECVSVFRDLLYKKNVLCMRKFHNRVELRTRNDFLKSCEFPQSVKRSIAKTHVYFALHIRQKTSIRKCTLQKCGQKMTKEPKKNRVVFFFLNKVHW